MSHKLEIIKLLFLPGASGRRYPFFQDSARPVTPDSNFVFHQTTGLDVGAGRFYTLGGGLPGFVSRGRNDDHQA